MAAMARLAAAPGDLFEPAFHLTYAGAGALLFIGRPLAASRLRYAAYAIAAEIAIAPFTLFHFHQYALGGSLTTIAMTPIVFVMLIAGGLFSALEIPLLLDLVALLNAVCTAMNRAASPASGFFAAPSTAAIVFAALGCVASLAFLRGRGRTTAVVLCLLVPPATTLITFHRRSSVSDPMLIALDVGQGDALLLRAGAKAILIDGGGRQDDPRFGESVLLPLLLDRGVRRLEAVILSHAHPDHCGGLASAIRHLDVREVWISPRRFRGDCAGLILTAVRDRAAPIRLLRGGEVIDLGDLSASITILETRFRRAPENNSSVIVFARARGRSMLLTGDVERDAERELASMKVSADLLKVPHHGSRTSSSPALLDAADPRVAVLSCGRNNFFGHPHPAVLDEFHRRRIRLWRTDLSGTIEMTFAHERLEVRPEIDTFQ
jgi:competence protein ComEC